MFTITAQLVDPSDYSVTLTTEDDGRAATASIRTSNVDGAGAGVDLTADDLLELELACRVSRDRILTRERRAENRRANQS